MCVWCTSRRFGAETLNCVSAAPRPQMRSSTMLPFAARLGCTSVWSCRRATSDLLCTLGRGGSDAVRVAVWLDALATACRRMHRATPKGAMASRLKEIVWRHPACRSARVPASGYASPQELQRRHRRRAPPCVWRARARAPACVLPRCCWSGGSLGAVSGRTWVALGFLGKDICRCICAYRHMHTHTHTQPHLQFRNRQSRL